MFDWRKYTEDPNNFQVTQEYRNYLLSIRKFILNDRDNYLLNECNGKAVLDIGSCEHTEEYINQENWFHRKLANKAKRVVGIDINKKLCDYAKNLGFDIRYMDACSEESLGIKFNIILAGDVIEHVSNIAGLLRFIKRHLAYDGKVLITTPNPFYYRHFKSVLKKGTFVANFEHTCWITPTCMNELAIREGLNLKQIIFSIKKLPFIINIFLNKNKQMEVLSEEYLFELSHPEGSSAESVGKC